MFEHGVVVGKFAPLHKGHEVLIRAALAQCKKVTVISYCKPELPGCDAVRRQRWLQQLFPTVNALVFAESEVRAWRDTGWKLPMPDNTAADIRQREFVAQLLWQRRLYDVDAVFSSESYGEGFAQYLQQFFTRQLQQRHPVTHVCVDAERIRVPVSASTIRADVHGLRHWLSPPVYADFAQRVCLIGGESSGKSTLATALAQQHDTQWVPEFGRYWWLLKNGELAEQDYLHIIRQQQQLEELAAGQANRYLFCDTGPLVTLCYYHDQFGELHPQLLQAALRPYQRMLLLKNDFDFVQDGSRRDADFSARQFAWYEEFLQRHGIPHAVIGGSLVERLAQVQALLSPAPEPLLA
jgi:HTH-type transcriptional regulator, transcriptional repressor of NAD biosynthesis genes